MWGSTARVMRKVPVRVTPSTASHCSSVMSTTFAVPPRPALFTSDVDPPQLGDGSRDEPAHVLLGVTLHRRDGIGLRPRACSRPVAASPSRRSWMSLIITRAPSSRQRFAVANPMPLPAAAVTSTVLPASSCVAFGVRRRGDRHRALAGQTEGALGDDVALDLVRAGVDRVRAGEEVHALQGASARRARPPRPRSAAPARPSPACRDRGASWPSRSCRSCRPGRARRRSTGRACAARGSAGCAAPSRPWRCAGGSAGLAPGRSPRDAAITCSSSFWNAICWPRVEAPRSKARVPIATFQPAPGSPTTFSAAVRAPSKNTSLNSESPVICTIGRTSTPGWRMGTSRYESPLCFGASGFVRHSTKHQSAFAAPEVHTFCPCDRPTRRRRARARVCTLARSEPAFGSE